MAEYKTNTFRPYIKLLLKFYLAYKYTFLIFLFLGHIFSVLYFLGHILTNL